MTENPMSELRLMDREEATGEARRLLADPMLAVFDSETTGLKNGEFIEVGVVDGRGNVLMDRRMRPNAHIEDGARKVHGISISDLSDEDPTWKAMPELVNALSGRTVVVYNAEYDGEIYDRTAKRLGLIARDGPPAHAVWVCAMDLYSRWRGVIDFRRRCYKRHRLVGGDHTSLGDARATLALLMRMAADEGHHGEQGQLF